MPEYLFEPFPKQDEFMEAALSGQYDFILYGGSMRGGKTYAVLGFLLILCKLYPGSRHVVVRKTLPRIKDTVLKTFDQVLPRSFVRKRESGSNGWEFTAINGSVIKFYSENIGQDPGAQRNFGGWNTIPSPSKRWILRKRLLR